jgi:uncharacterized protein
MSLGPPIAAIAVKTAMAVAGTAYAVYGIRLFLRQNAIVFRPIRVLSGDPGTLGLDFQDIIVETRHGIQLHGWWIQGRPGAHVILFFPGSIGNLSRELQTFYFLVSLGATVMAIDYPGFGRSGGRPTETGCYQTAEAAWDFAVRAKGIPPRNIILWGRSVGAAVAARLAGRCECAGLICQSGATSVPDVAAQRYRFVPARWFCYIRFNTLRFVALCLSPVLVMHSRSDTIIPISHGLRILARASSPKRFVSLIGDHYSDEWLATPDLRAALKPLIECDALDVIHDQDYAH